MEALLVSTGIVAIAEIGDKTQLLALLLAAKFKRPLPIILGIFVATIANHALAALAGTLVADLLTPDIMRWVLGASFLAMAAWALVPDTMDEAPEDRGAWGAFLGTTIAFFLVEMGDKTQVATVALAARYHAVLMVAAGTTLGMMIANVPAVLLGEAATRVLPLNLVRIIAAVLFGLLGVATLLNLGGLF